MESRVLELATDVVEQTAEVDAVAQRADEPIDVVHPESNRFHVKRGNGTAQGLGLLLEPVSRAAG